MFQRILIAFFLVLFLAGCATTNRTSNNQTQQLQSQVKELQDKIRFLEEEAQAKSREISELENELYKTQTARQKTESSTTVQLSVKQIQTALKNAGFYKSSIDGKLGKQTKNAIKAFQEAHGLKADGMVGKRTIAELSKYLN